MGRHITSFTGAGDYAGAGAGYTFVKNSYIVYPGGLGGDKPNPSAVSQAEHLKNTMSYQSNNKLTGLDYIYYFLEDLAKKERAKEIDFLRKQRDILKKEKPAFFKDTNTLHALDTIITGLGRTGPATETVSSAFTLLLNPLGYDEIKRQLNSSHNSGGAQHMSDIYNVFCRDVFNSVYEKYRDELERQLVVDASKGKFQDITDPKRLNHFLVRFAEDFSVEANAKIQKDLGTQESFQKSIFDELAFSFKNNGLYTSAETAKFEKIRNKYKHKSAGMEKGSKEKELGARLVSTHISKTTDKRQKAKDIKTIIDQIIQKTMGDFVWQYAERMPGQNKDHISTYVYFGHTGDKNITRQTAIERGILGLSGPDAKTSHSGKATTDSFALFSFIPIEIDEKVMNKYEERIIKGEQAAFEEYLKEAHAALVKQEGLDNLLKNMFIVHFNTKGYKSQKDLTVVNERSLDSLAGTFKDIAQNFYTIGDMSTGRAAYRNDHLGLALDSLIFMLNNTVKGASFCNDKKLVEALISYNCCTWMWDGMAATIKDIDQQLNGITNIHLFQSGGDYFTISDLLMEITKLFRSYFLGTNVDSFLITSLKPATFDPEKEYERLKQFHPLFKSSFTKGKGKMKRGKTIIDYEDREEQLQKRWMEMRNLGLKGTTLSIKFRQRQIDELNGRLSLLRKLQ